MGTLAVSTLDHYGMQWHGNSLETDLTTSVSVRHVCHSSVSQANAERDGSARNRGMNKNFEILEISCVCAKITA